MQVEPDASGCTWGVPMHRSGGEFAFRDDWYHPPQLPQLSPCQRTVYHINVGATWHHHGSCPLAVERALVRGLHRPTVCGSRCIGQAESLHSEMTVSPSTTAPTESLSATVYHINVGATWHHHGSCPLAVERAPVRGLHWKRLALELARASCMGWESGFTRINKILTEMILNLLEFTRMLSNEIPRSAELDDGSKASWPQPILPFPQPASSTRQLQLLRRWRTC